MAASRLDQALREAGFRGEILAEEPLARHTTWQIGGPAEALATPRDLDDLFLAVRWAVQSSVVWRALGNGSNLLVSDAGVRGLVIRIRKVLDGVSRDGPRLVAGAGASYPAVANTAVTHGLAGLEFAAGVPGTVGGAVVMNAGWHAFETGSLIAAVEVLDPEGRVSTLPGAECAFGYRTSRFRGGREVILSATFCLEPRDPQQVQREMQHYVASRQANQPTALPSCGSVYLKPPGDFAGRLIDDAGLKGLRSGGLEVSPKHANFFINRGGGTCSDALALMEKVEQAVQSRFGVRLTREVERWE